MIFSDRTKKPSKATKESHDSHLTHQGNAVIFVFFLVRLMACPPKGPSKCFQTAIAAHLALGYGLTGIIPGIIRKATKHGKDKEIMQLKMSTKDVVCAVDI